MSKAWKIVISIVLIAILLGAVCIGVGMLTGADMERIYNILDKRYMVGQYYQWFTEVVDAYKAVL